MKNRWVQVAIVAVGALLIWGSVKSLWDLKRAGGRVEEAKAVLNLAKKDNQELKMKLSTVTSAEFVEKEARDKLNLQKPGETVVIISDDQMTDVRSEMLDLAERPLSNPEKWWKLFFE